MSRGAASAGGARAAARRLYHPQPRSAQAQIAAELSLAQAALAEAGPQLDPDPTPAEIRAAQVSARAAAQGDARPSWLRVAKRQAIALGLVVLFAGLLHKKLAALDTEAILTALGAVSLGQWALAGLATLGSFLALAQYDALIHRALATRVAPERARRAGWTAIAISQTVGFGLVSGALVRWRMLPGLSLVEASKLAATVAATFLAGWAVLSAGALIVLPQAVPALAPAQVQGLALAALGGLGALALAGLWAPGLRLGRVVLRLPSLPVMARILWLTMLDTAFAAAALWVLLPAGDAMPFTTLFPAFLLALGAGFVSGTPGGVGPFEVALLTLLPGTEGPSVLAAILAWRAVYYGAPAALAIAVVAFARPGTDAPAERRLVAPAPRLSPRLTALIVADRQAELGLMWQGEHGALLSSDLHGGWMIGRTPQALVGLLDPFGTAEAASLLPDLRRAARAEGRIASLYKIDARTAVAARRAGWVVAPVALECQIDPRAFSLETPARAGLRRKLRKAAKTGLVTELACGPLPLSELGAVAAAWAQARGGERGFSMGRFTPDYIAHQEVVIARLGGRIVGFASFHATRASWVLDLMRPAPDAPDGTMQALIHTAIEAARGAGVARFSLAALPPEAARVEGPGALIWRRAEAQAGAAGLRQFKMSFAPSLAPRYIAAPSHAALALAAADIARAIHRPAPLAQSPAPRESRPTPSLRARWRELAARSRS